ncbi:MAG: hypothetical protein ABSA30_03725 [Candidatus Aminicenantales bacterium]|jgi:hypothetical protein
MTLDDAGPKAGLTGREFLGAAASSAAAGMMIVPRRVLGGPGYTAPSDRLNIGCIAVGGKGFSDARAAGTENIVALRFKDSKLALQWDPVTMEFPNLPEANPFVHKTYRKGWSL